MPDCGMNKNRLLSLHFHEGTAKEERAIQKHVDGCGDCRAYLALLAETDQALLGWENEFPLPGTLDTILTGLPEPQTAPEPAAKPSVAVTPIVMIILSIVAIITGFSLLHDKITLLPFWETMKSWAPVQFLGSFGVTAVAFFLLGIVVTLALSPVLILDRQAKNRRYQFN